jgi:hypothetical protein
MKRRTRPTAATLAAHVAAHAPSAEAASVALDKLHPLDLANGRRCITCGGPLPTHALVTCSDRCARAAIRAESARAGESRPAVETSAGQGAGG